MKINEIITRENLIKTIKELAKNKLYKNEQQLQFDLAWEIKKELDKNNLNDWDVEFEYLSATKPKCDDENQKNIYTDLIVLNKSTGEYIPIELKYKTRISYNLQGNQVLKNQGARDLGRFNYLWDLQRIHILKNKDRGYIIDSNLKTMLNGFAIILTNDGAYWEMTTEKLDNKGQNPLYKSFCIGEGQIIKANEKLNWKPGKSCVNDTWREKVCPLCFNYDKICHWIDCQNVETSIEFKCLVLGIK